MELPDTQKYQCKPVWYKGSPNPIYNIIHGYLFLLSELHLHLFVSRLILPNTVPSYEIAADVSKFRVLLSSFLY